MVNVTVNRDPRNKKHIIARQREIAGVIREMGYIPMFQPGVRFLDDLTTFAIGRRYSRGLGKIIPMKEVIGELYYARSANGCYVDMNPWELNVFGDNIDGLSELAEILGGRYNVDVDLRLEDLGSKLSFGF